MKKTAVVFFIVFVVLVIGVSLASKKAPALLMNAIEKALNKTVVIKSIDYHFPAQFELIGLEIREKNAFKGELSFYAEKIRLNAGVLTSLSKQSLEINKIEVEKATVTVRKSNGRLIHALSDAAGAEPPVATDQASQTIAPEAAKKDAMPIAIDHFFLKDSSFTFIDYDVQPEGFVILLDQIQADIHAISLPHTDKKTSYELAARIPQGREYKPGQFEAKGWTVFKSRDTDFYCQIVGLYLPYFRPYYSTVTPALIREGFLDSRLNLKIERDELTSNAYFELASLHFESYEAGNQLFGMTADEILSFLRDSSGRLKFEIVVGWNLNDRSVSPRQVIRRSIEQSLKRTILGNLGNVIGNTLERISKGGDGAKDDIENTLKQVSQLFQ